VQFETYENSGLADAATGITVSIVASGTSMGGTGTPVATTSTGIVALDQGLFQYLWNVAPTVAPGDYTVTWTGVRNSDSVTVTYVQNVTIAAVPAGSPASGMYATVAQYQARTGDTLTPAATVLARLQLASEQIDYAIIGAVYATDANGTPLNPLLADVLMRACIEQVRYLNANDDDAHIKRDYTSMNVAGVSYTRSANTQGSAFPPIAPQALIILKTNGVLQKAVLINW
jgi:hypothetical protein